MTFPFNKPVTLIDRIPIAEKDEYGDDQVTTDERVVMAAFDPGAGGLEIGDAAVDPRPAVLLPLGITVDWTGAVRVDGVTYEVDGVPQSYDPGTGFGGVRVPLKAQLRR